MATTYTAGDPGDARAPARFAPQRPGALRCALGALVSLGHRVLGRARYDDFRLERIEGFALLVLPTVFNPRLLRTGAFFAHELGTCLQDRDSHVLDLGTGSGLCALVAARRGARVTAVDLNPAAVRCASVNALINGLDQRIGVRGGDLFGPVANERFDVVLFNPPFYPAEAADDRDRAWRGAGIAERFASGLAPHLKPGGYALVLLSSVGDAAGFVEALSRRGFALSIAARREYLNERLIVLKIESRGLPEAAPG